MTSAAGRRSASASSTARKASSSTSRTSWECPLTTSTEAVELPARTGSPRRAGGLVLGLSTAYLTLIVLIPIAAVVAASLEGGLSAFWDDVTSPSAVAALKLTFVASLVVVAVNAVTGTLIAWVLVRDDFRGKSVVNAVIDLPFALPTIVAGLTLLAVYGPKSPLGFDVAYTRAAIVLALAFVTLPFVVRAVQPVLMELDRDMEEAAASLGSRPLTTFRRIILPNLMPAVLSGAALSFGKAVGEFGSVVLISGNIPFDTEVASVNIFKSIESGEPEAAAAVSVVLLVMSFIVLAVADVLERRSRRHDA
jgi:sulfate transport system permease protein